MNNLELIALKDFPLIEPGHDISSTIFDCIVNNQLMINDSDIIVIAQKIISKAENRYIDLDNIEISEEAKNLSKKLDKNEGLIQAIINESNKILSTKKNVIIVEHKLGFINVNAGIDLSNVPSENLALLLPEDPKKSAKNIQTDLSKKLNKNISVIITDSMTRPYRSGVINFALASHNILSLKDLKGHDDMYGRKLKGTEVAIADELASAAGLLMGQSNEKKPVIVIKGFNNNTQKTSNAFDLIVSENEDLYRQ